MLRDLFAYVWSMLCLFPLLWIAALDFASPGPRKAQRAPGGHWNLATTTLVALAVASAFAGTSLLARDPPDSADWFGRPDSARRIIRAAESPFPSPQWRKPSPKTSGEPSGCVA